MSDSLATAARGRSLPGKLLRWTRNLALALLGVVLVVYLGAAFDSRRKPDLAPWHTVSLESEFRARNGGPETTFTDYLEREARVFEELERSIYRAAGHSSETLLTRYHIDGAANPQRMPTNWNRSYQLAPERAAGSGDRQGEWPRGAALLVHGLTDSPYSLRAVAKILQSEGYHVVGLRLPGHGTNPGTLATITWQDWKAAVQLAARHTKRLADRGKFLVVGYSAGGALAVDYTIEAILDEELTQPDRLVLFSPAIGITRFAALASWHKALSWLDYFEKFRWDEIQPEYDPFKYNSFPLNAGEQMHLLSLAVQERLRDLDRAGRMAEMPDILAFQSLVDSTVLTDAIISDLFDDLERPGSELVLFDLNRVAQLRPFISARHTHTLDQIEANANRPYVATVIANIDETTLSVAAFSYAPRTSEKTRQELGAEWPREVYSLSHVAMPFTPDDPLYGNNTSKLTPGVLRLGILAPRGERNLLRVSVSNLMRLRYNPFFDYVDGRLRSWVD